MEDAAERLKVSKAKHIHGSPVRNFWTTSPVIPINLILCQSLKLLFEFDHKISHNRAGDLDQELHSPHVQSTWELCSVCSALSHTGTGPALFQKEGLQGKFQKT